MSATAPARAKPRGNANARPTRQRYVEAVARAIALLRAANEALDDFLDLGERGWDEVIRQARPPDASYQYARWSWRDLDHVNYHLDVLGQVIDVLPYDARELADRLTVQVRDADANAG